ncbi:MAG: hypothetical protein ACP5I8_15545 [Phycisphaerae bacterium]
MDLNEKPIPKPLYRKMRKQLHKTLWADSTVNAAARENWPAVKIEAELTLMGVLLEAGYSSPVPTATPEVLSWVDYPEAHALLEPIVRAVVKSFGIEPSACASPEVPRGPQTAANASVLEGKP